MSFRNGSHYGRGDLVVVNATHLRWQSWPNGASVAEDEAWITNPYYRRDITGGGSSDNEPWWLAALLRCSFFWAMVPACLGQRHRRRIPLFGSAAVCASQRSAPPRNPAASGVGSVGGGDRRRAGGAGRSWKEGEKEHDESWKRL